MFAFQFLVGILLISLLIILGLELADYFQHKEHYGSLSKMIYYKTSFLDEFSNIISEFIFLAYVLLVESEIKIQVRCAYKYWISEREQKDFVFE